MYESTIARDCTLCVDKKGSFYFILPGSGTPVASTWGSKKAEINKINTIKNVLK